jgi:hypothetical protein
MQKEIAMVAKAKNVSEKSVYEMGFMEYLNTLAILDSINKDIEREMSKKD